MRPAAAPTTPSTRATARTGTRSRRARRSGRVMAELMGRDGGLCRGLGGSMHLVDVEHGLLGATGVVGGNVPLALGSALAARLLGGDQVAVVFFGDGAVQGGIFVESVNLATLWRLPVILVCENNGFAEFTPRSAHTNDRARQRRRRAVRTSSGRRSTATTSSRSRAAFARFLAARARRRRAVPARVPDAPAARPLRGRPAALPRGARRRGVAGARSDPAPAAARPRRGLARRRRAGASRGGGARGGRGGGRVRAREPVPAAGPHRRARLRAT